METRVSMDGGGGNKTGMWFLIQLAAVAFGGWLGRSVFVEIRALRQSVALLTVENAELDRANQYLNEVLGVLPRTPTTSLDGLRAAVVEFVREVKPAGVLARVVVAETHPNGARGYDVVVEVSA